MSEPPHVVRVEDLRKSFVVPEREAGLGAALRSLIHKKTREVQAVDGIGFDIDAGEVVGFLGPNGAGKTTTLKMLSGLLHPTSGQIDVLGHIPSRREKDYLRRITLIMGQPQSASMGPAGRRHLRAEPSHLSDTPPRLPPNHG